MADPYVTPYPGPELRAQLPADVWAALLAAWTQIAELYLARPPPDALNAPAMARFLETYLASAGAPPAAKLPAVTGPAGGSAAGRSLRRAVFFVLYRALAADASADHDATCWAFIRLYASRRPAELRTLVSLRAAARPVAAGTLDPLAAAASAALGGGSASDRDVRALRVLLEDDAIARRWLAAPWFSALADAPRPPRTVAVATKLAYVSLTALTRLPAQLGPIVQQLISDSPAGSPDSLLAAVVVQTRLLGALRRRSGAAAVDAAAVSLETFRLRLPAANAPPQFPRTLTRAERRARRRAAAVATVREIFPDLDRAFVDHVLQSHSDSVEAAMAYLAELSPDDIHASAAALAGLSIADDASDVASAAASITATPDASDDEDLRYAPGQLHFGKKPRAAMDAMLSTVPDKQRILDSLKAIYDDEEDERDDTYDDVDATGIDDDGPDSYRDRDDGIYLGTRPARPAAAAPAPSAGPAAPAPRAAVDPRERLLWETYQSAPDMFLSAQRGTPGRASLRKATGWSDEQLEGWARMLERDPRRRRRLETAYAFAGNRRQASPARPVATDDGADDADDDEQPAAAAASSATRGRGRGRGRVARGSRANHGRRDARTRKMAAGLRE
ncbi:uncharacterized protein V1510DRAFT_437357 [Dipodascopsis tothii]|uniref:uncharacterized protein n=1 Tax=Dipodascopsis tothii TaxID=44089 RepID=UPI0034CF40BC